MSSSSSPLSSPSTGPVVAFGLSGLAALAGLTGFLVVAFGTPSIQRGSRKQVQQGERQRGQTTNGKIRDSGDEQMSAADQPAIDGAFRLYADEGAQLVYALRPGQTPRQWLDSWIKTTLTHEGMLAKMPISLGAIEYTKNRIAQVCKDLRDYGVDSELQTFYEKLHRKLMEWDSSDYKATSIGVLIRYLSHQIIDENETPLGLHEASGYVSLVISTAFPLYNVRDHKGMQYLYKFTINLSADKKRKYINEYILNVTMGSELDKIRATFANIRALCAQLTAVRHSLNGQKINQEIYIFLANLDHELSTDTDYGDDVTLGARVRLVGRKILEDMYPHQSSA